MSTPPASPPHRLRAPGLSLDVDTLLTRVWPGSSPEAREALVTRGAVRVQARPVRRLRTRVPPGAFVELCEPFGPEAAVPSADGPCHALVPALPWAAGELPRRRGMASAVALQRVERRGAVDLLSLEPVGARGERPASFVDDLRRALAAVGHPVLADTRHGGILVAGGLRVALGEAARPAWPEEPVFPGRTGAAARVRVSDATRRVLRRGHPWILQDDESDDVDVFAPGTRVRLEAPDGEALGIARIEGPGRLAARRWSGSEAFPEDDAVDARVAAALQRRRRLLDDATRTDVFRLLHGEADGLPGLFVDRLGSVLRVLRTSAGDDGYCGAALAAVVRALEPRLGCAPSIVEVVHLRHAPEAAWLRTRLLAGPLPGGSVEASTRLAVREQGVVFRVDPGLSRPTRSSPGFGLYPDQRDNRARLIEGAPEGGRLLNLFAHTGAFSVAWLAAGLGPATSVDLSASYLRWLDENLAANGLDPGRHHGVRLDGRRFLETLAESERFDAIVVDPPTAAAAGRRFWSVARDLAPLVERALRHLAPGGRLLVCRNDRRRAELRELVEGCARQAGVRLAALASAPPSSDFPALEGFPEGDPFSGVLATRR